MHKILLLTTALLLSFVACQKRACPQTESYNGLHNALICDYKSQTFNLEQNLSQHNSKTIDLQKRRNKLENEVYTQENQLDYQKEQIKNKELLLSDVKRSIEHINSETKIKEILENLNLQIKNMHKTLKENSP